MVVERSRAKTSACRLANLIDIVVSSVPADIWGHFAIPLPSKSLHIIYSLFILPFDVIQSELLAA